MLIENMSRESPLQRSGMCRILLRYHISGMFSSAESKTYWFVAAIFLLGRATDRATALAFQRRLNERSTECIVSRIYHRLGISIALAIHSFDLRWSAGVWTCRILSTLKISIRIYYGIAIALIIHSLEGSLWDFYRLRCSLS